MYDDGFYEMINDGSYKSAKVVVPLVLDVLPSRPVDVLDFGCGQGAWLRGFEEAGVQGYGMDGHYVDTSKLWFDVERFTPVDFDRTIPTLDRKFDLAISLEVAEHVHPRRADDFVGMLCAASDTVLFSAALPGQGGVGHINEQWPAYWAEKFAARGFSMSGDLRWGIWDDLEVEPWYKQNLMLCSKTDLGLSGKHHAVVHPIVWNHIRGAG